MEIRIFGRSDKGLVRDHNEDSLWFDENLGAAIVADGLGGHAAGEVASAIAVKIFRDAMRSNLSRGCSGDDIRHVMAGAVGASNREILDNIKENRCRAGMATTVVCFAVRRNCGVVAHVGDSRAYLIRTGEIIPLTKDHSFVMELVEKGVISPEEAAIHPYRNLITRTVGGEEKAEADFVFLPVEADDYYLLCSDGLSNVLGEEEILEVVMNAGSVETACDALVQRTLERGAPDNVTVVVAHVIFLDPEPDVNSPVTTW